MKLTAKEQRLHDYLLAELAKGNHQPNIGETRIACKTTVRTLLGKTLPSLRKKVDWL